MLGHHTIQFVVKILCRFVKDDWQSRDILTTYCKSTAHYENHLVSHPCCWAIKPLIMTPRKATTCTLVMHWTQSLKIPILYTSWRLGGSWGISSTWWIYLVLCLWSCRYNIKHCMAYQHVVQTQPDAIIMFCEVYVLLELLLDSTHDHCKMCRSWSSYIQNRGACMGDGVWMRRVQPHS